MTSSADDENKMNRMESIDYFTNCIKIGKYITIDEYLGEFPRIDDSAFGQQTNPSYRAELKSYLILILMVTDYCKYSYEKVSEIFESICNEDLVVGLYILSLFDSELLLTPSDNKDMQCYDYDLECRNIQLSLAQIWNKVKSDKLYCHLINTNSPEREDYLLYCGNLKLKRASLRYINLSQMQLKNSIFHECNLENIDFSYSSMENINLSYSNIQNGNFIRSNLINANLLNTNLCSTNFTNANLCKAHLTYGQLANANFSYANLEGAEFMMCSVNNDTILKGRPEHFIDKDTNFTGVSLSSARIDPRLSNTLERNVRKKQWEKWYYDKNIILTSPIRFFWYLSDYGSSGKRACFCLLLVNLLAWIFHNICHANINISSAIMTLLQVPLCDKLWYILLNITNYQQIYLSPTSTACVFQSTIVSLFNYFLLAVLVTRFAIMFQNKSY